MKERNIFSQQRLSLAVMLALTTSAGLQVANAGVGWGSSADISGAEIKTPTYYANSPSGLLPAEDCLTSAVPDKGPFDTTAPMLATNITSAEPTEANATNPLGVCDTGKALRKFVDTLPGLDAANNLGNSIPVAIADKEAYPGSDYYEIAAVEYTQQMHSDLKKPTRLRGYVQISPNGTVPLNYLKEDGTPGSAITLPNGKAAMAVAKPSYLGPVINSTTGTPTRVKFYNLLPAGVAGNLHVPVDETITGAGTGPVNGLDGKPMKYQQNRVEIHLHGGDNPWISDGTPHQWILPYADEIALKSAGKAEMARGVGAVNVPDMPDPGPGAMTYYFPNGQGGRLMFYHDHALGLTRLNVYAGVAAGYLLNDLPDVGENYPALKALLPAEQIPLIIQDKTFVPKDIAMQDAKWNSSMGTEGDLWYPHVYETNQDPNSFDATNPVGRWDWGPWFWPVFPSTYDLPTGEISAINAATGLSEVSTTPEAFMDTALVNGTAYPTMTVEPKAYRFRVLNGANDRFLNLGLYLAADKNTTNALTPTDSAATKLCSGMTLNTTTNKLEKIVDGNVVLTQEDCTEVKMVNFDVSYKPPSAPYTVDGSTSFPTTGGITGTGWGAQVGGMFPQGAPDPATAGPHIVQIGNEAGLLANPLDIPSTPLNYEYNKRSVTVLGVLEHGLYLGNAERADVLIDFSDYAGKTLILYNDAPAPVPASDPRIDYYTGNGDNTATGGAPNVKPGYGPNTRTIMQIVVAPNATGTIKTVDVAALETTLPKAYATTQPMPVVPEPEYNAAFSGNPAYASIAPATRNNARIYTGAIYLNALTGMSFTTPEEINYFPVPNKPGTTTPCSSLTECNIALTAQKAQPNNGVVTAPAGTKVNVYVQNKAIQELFDPNYGRMNATLGVELPFTSAVTQTTIPLGYVDPVTETVADGETQFWKITHNGVDTHPVHFHLVNVQVINRMGWDGTIKLPANDEIGWKETIKMNPLEDIVVAVRAKKPTLQGVTTTDGVEIPSNAFGLPNSERLMDPSQPAGSKLGFTQINAADGTPANVINAIKSFGWEYVWHCHILGHEENDFMRPVVFNANELAPAAPTALTLTGNVLTWTDNAKTEYAYKVERAELNNGVVGEFIDLSKTADQTVGAAPLANANTFTDNTARTPNTDYQYKVTAIGAAGSVSATVNLATAPIAPVLNTVAVNSTSQVTLSWADKSSNETGFQIVRNGVVVTTVAANTTSFVDTGLLKLTPYAYQVVAVNTVGNTPSNTVSVTIPADVVKTPVSLTATIASSTSATLRWTDKSTNENNFTVWRSVNGAAATQIGIVTRSNNQRTQVDGIVNFTSTGLIAGNTYAYYVIANSTAPAAISSAPSNTATVSFTAAIAPSNLAGTIVRTGNRNSVTLNWTDNANNETGFTVQRATNAAFTRGLNTANVAANVTRLTQNGLSRNGNPRPTYYYRIRANGTVGNSGWSNVFSVQAR